MSLESNLQKLAHNEQSYRPNAEVAQLLKEKEFIMVVGPSAIGKSTLMNKITAMNTDFARVQITTTRPRRNDDEQSVYEYIPHTDKGVQEFLDLVQHTQLIQYAVHPTTGFLYATRPKGYPGKYNMLDTQAQVVHSLSQLPFHDIHVVCLVTKPEVWQKWFSQRNQQGTDDYKKRLDEAIRSLELMLSMNATSIRWIFNDPNNISMSAHTFIESLETKENNTLQNRQFAIALLSLAHQMKE